MRSEYPSRIACEVAATSEWTPDRFNDVLQSRASTVTPDMLQNSELTTGTDDPDEFVDHRLRICDATQDKRHDRSVELIVRERERFTVAVHDRRVKPQALGPSSGTVSHCGVGVDPVHSNTFVGEIRKRRPAPTTEVEDDTIEVGSEIPAVVIEHRIEIPFSTAVRVGEEGIEHSHPL